MIILCMNLSIGPNGKMVKQIKKAAIEHAIMRYKKKCAEANGDTAVAETFEIHSFAYSPNTTPTESDDTTQMRFVNASIRRYPGKKIVIIFSLGDICQLRTSAVHVVDYWIRQPEIEDFYILSFSFVPVSRYLNSLVSAFHVSRGEKSQRGRAPLYPPAFKEKIRSLKLEKISLSAIARTLSIAPSSLYAICYADQDEDTINSRSKGAAPTDDQLKELRWLLAEGDAYTSLAAVFDDGITEITIP